MTRFRLRQAWMFALPAVAWATQTAGSAQPPATPVVSGCWIRPAEAVPALPVWGHAEGLRVGIWPAPAGPRGLLRIAAPHVDVPRRQPINFIAVEPIVTQRRGFSELEFSRLDNRRGKRMWSTNDPHDTDARDPLHPARGVVTRHDDYQTLRVVVVVEAFENGAAVSVELTFRSDRPEEVGLRAVAHEGSAPVRSCILTATMGNYARLRRLHLREGIISSAELWPDFTGNGFARHARFGVDQLHHLDDGSVLVAATSDEPEPAAANYAASVPRWWRYQGRPASQYWRCEQPPAELVAQVNGRVRYWACHAPIPGGISFENFELVLPFQAARQLWFGVTPEPPARLFARQVPATEAPSGQRE